MPAEWLVAFMLGLLSSTHCLGMCGGIAGSLTFSLSPEIRQRPRQLATFSLAYNLGRISSYVIAGSLAGLSAGLVLILAPQSPLLMGFVGTGFLIALGLYIGGWLPHFARLEQIGRPVWRRLEPVGRRLLPVRHPSQAYGFGLVWGWLPCGLVYSALIYSLTTGSASRGALFMLMFGLGTLPMMMTVGVMASRMARLLRHPRTRHMAGILVILLAPLPFILLHLRSS